MARRVLERQQSLAQSLILYLPEVFDPAEFIHPEFKVWQGPPGGDGLHGEEAVYEPAGLSAIDVQSIRFENFLDDDESLGKKISGQAKVHRARESGHTLLGGRTALALWRNYQASPRKSILEWLRKKERITWMELLGVVLRYPGSDGYRCTPYFHFDRGIWGRYCGCLDYARGAEHLAAVI